MLKCFMIDVVFLLPRKKVFYNIFRLSQIFDLFAHSASLASHYMTNRLFKYLSDDNSILFKKLSLDNLCMQTSDWI